MYLYIDKDYYIYGYGSEDEGDNSIKIEEIPFEVEQNLGCYQYINKEYILDKNRKAFMQCLYTYERKLIEMTKWFDWYDTQIIQKQRYDRLGIEFNQNIEELDTQAIENSQLIKEYRELLNTTYDSSIDYFIALQNL